MDKQSVVIMFRIGIIKAKKKIKEERHQLERIRQEINETNDFFKLPKVLKLKIEIYRCNQKIGQLQSLITKLNNALCCLRLGDNKPTLQIIERELTSIEKTSITNQNYFKNAKTQRHIKTMHSMIKNLNC
jgi:hypothetical protein